MKLSQELWTSDGTTHVGSANALEGAELVLGFGAPQLLSDAEVWRRLREKWSTALIVACSTAGEISGTQVLDDSLALTAMQFDETRVRCAEVVLEEGMSSSAVGRRLAEQLLGPRARDSDQLRRAKARPQAARRRRGRGRSPSARRGDAADGLLFLW